jgi:hypothetical protein
MSPVQQEIEQVFREYEAIWDSQQYGRLKELWDTEDPEPFYLAEEQQDWRFGWDALHKYWEPVPGKRRIEAILMRYRDIHVKQIASDLAIAACWVRHDLKLRGPMKPTGGDARVMAVFRKRDNGWRFIAYAEGPISPLYFMQKLYELNVSPDFPEFHREVMEAEEGSVHAQGKVQR